MKEDLQQLLFTNSHEWVRRQNEIITVGITEYAQNSLGEIVYVDFPKINEEFRSGEEVCGVESVKSAAEIYAPVDGTVTEINEKLSSLPQKINEDPYGEGWIFRLKIKNEQQLKNLLDQAAYEKISG